MSTVAGYFYSEIAELFADRYYTVVTYECNLDLVLDRQLYAYAEFSFIEGLWEDVEEQAKGTLEMFDQNDPKSIEVLSPLQQALKNYQAFEEFIGSREFTEEEGEEFYKVEYQLVKELVEFYGDPDSIVVARLSRTSA